MQKTLQHTVYSCWPGSTRDPTKLLEASKVVVSSGLSNFAESNSSTGSCQEFSTWQRGRHVVESHLSERQNPGAKEMLLRICRLNFPALCEGRKIQVVDCTVFQNPDSKSELQKHIGAHPDIMHGVYSDPMFPEVHSVLRSLSLSGKNLVVCVQERRLCYFAFNR